MFPGGEADTLYNGTNYTAMLELVPTGDEIYGGLMKIHVDTILVGAGFYDPWGLPPAVNIGWLNFPPGIYPVKVLFGEVNKKRAAPSAQPFVLSPHSGY